MKCKRCGFEWQSYGEALTCPGCGVVTALTQSEKQTLWEEAYEAEKIKDLALRARCYLALAEQGDEKAHPQDGCIPPPLTAFGSLFPRVSSLATAKSRRFSGFALRRSLVTRMPLLHSQRHMRRETPLHPPTVTRSFG